MHSPPPPSRKNKEDNLIDIFNRLRTLCLPPPLDLDLFLCLSSAQRRGYVYTLTPQASFQNTTSPLSPLYSFNEPISRRLRWKMPPQHWAKVEHQATFVQMRRHKERTKRNAHTCVDPLDWSNSAPCDVSSLALTCDAIARAFPACSLTSFFPFYIVTREKKKKKEKVGMRMRIQTIGLAIVIITFCFLFYRCFRQCGLGGFLSHFEWFFPFHSHG